MYGLIGKMRSQSDKRDEVITIMTAGSVKMPGCLSYVIAKDPTDPDGIWITEVWIDKDSHAGSLKIPEVIETIKKAMPLIAGFDQHFETEPVNIG
jgi:quinol monooxygenase YgiN